MHTSNEYETEYSFVVRNDHSVYANATLYEKQKYQYKGEWRERRVGRVSLQKFFSESQMPIEVQRIMVMTARPIGYPYKDRYIAEHRNEDAAVTHLNALIGNGYMFEGI
jgi:hypothetical protein